MRTATPEPFACSSALHGDRSILQHPLQQQFCRKHASHSMLCLEEAWKNSLSSALPKTVKLKGLSVCVLVPLLNVFLSTICSLHVCLKYFVSTTLPWKFPFLSTWLCYCVLPKTWQLHTLITNNIAQFFPIMLSEKFKFILMGWVGNLYNVFGYFSS